MPYDPFLEPSLAAYLDATDRHSDAVEELSNLVGNRKHLEFKTAALRVRELAAKAEEAHTALLESRRAAATRI